MKMRTFMAGVCAGLIFCVQGVVSAAIPTDVPKDVKYILGFYYGNGENILIRENNGGLELLYRTLNEDKCFARANIFPLQKEHFDSYMMNEAGPITGSEANVSFERDKDGYGITCKVGGHRYSRYFLGTGNGENALPFRLPAVSDWTALRGEAEQAVMPPTLAAGKQAQLISLAAVPGLRLNSVYAGSDNCFGAPLYKSQGLYLAADAAAALEKVNKELNSWGYGLLVWDAYRPWSVSKLAYLALPENKKFMLEDPDLKGSVHNTGIAVDVSLYDLKTGESAEMISGFDEPSMRQYASYSGGTERQRYLRALLRETMEKHGFSGIEMEWWHFEYGSSAEYAHLNIPFESIQ